MSATLPKETTAKVIKAMQVTVRSRGLPEAEEKIMALLAAQGLRVYGRRSYNFQDELSVLVIVADGDRAQKLLAAAGFSCCSTSVVLTKVRGILPKLLLGAELARVGIGVVYSYIPVSASKDCYVVYKTMDDEAAVRAIRNCPQFFAAHPMEEPLHANP